MIAFLEARRAGLFARGQWLPNVIAGVIVGVVALPLAMAFAIASGARPEQGLYTAIIGGACVSLLGGSRVQIAGPTGAFVAILAGITARYGISGLETATLMAGIILVLMGATKMGSVIRFIPAPVIIGFTGGIAVTIFVGQWRDFLGLPPVQAEHFHERLWRLIEAMPQLNWPTAALGLGSLLLVVYTPRVSALSRLPGPLVAMLVATVAQAIFHFPGVATLGTAFGGIPRGLPTFSVPDLSPAHVVTLLGPAFTIALLGAIESLLSAVVADGMSGTRHDSNQELIGQGIANIMTPLFGGFAATGAIARTATNIRNGATGPLSGLVHAATLIAVLLILTPLAASIPLAALAAILFVVSWNMSDVGRFRSVMRTAPAADRWILLITFLLTVFADLIVAVNVGVILAVLQFIRRMSETVDTQPAGGPTLKAELAALGLAALPPDVQVYEITGPMFFGAIENIRRPLLEIRPYPKTLIIRLDRVPFMDISGIHVLDETIHLLRKKGVAVMLCEANPRVRAKLYRAGVVASTSDPTCDRSFGDALVHATMINVG
ncbi:MAG: putative sulfate transporter, SulP family [Gammaproteobacteria bacterium]|nr:putative sulfate transporter, SulP family [Gammaproteobacteria bacterium]